uniref:Uncharacterized protein n=1 Tax=Proboscia inermis TaxID=420281 RepID=A0A7S0CAZ8_9STRA|mmetsp:Transcript_35095/g.35307  ORF Transcript_35095/g.35307 Transcript_35095/m.35307 type:complete len:208 (+) Transcript_35095:58-681(+)
MAAFQTLHKSFLKCMWKNYYHGSFLSMPARNMRCSRMVLKQPYDGGATEFVVKVEKHQHDSVMEAASKSSATGAKPRRERLRKMRKGSKGGKVDGKIPSLKDFLYKASVLKQYRTFLRAVSCISDSMSKEHAKEEIIKGYRLNVSTPSKSMAFKEGERKLQQFCSMVGYHHPSMNLNDDDSWLNIDDKEDERGRVGDLWPWQEKDGQ